jgi:hypothetical protein
VSSLTQGAWLAGHVPHIVAGCVVLLATVVYRVLEHRRHRGELDRLRAARAAQHGPYFPTPPEPQAASAERDRGARAALWLAAGGLVGAAVVHAVVVPQHFAEALSYGLFFVVSALLQTAAAVLVVRAPTRPLLQVVVGSSVAIVVLWAVTRTSGLPLGPEPGEAEPVGILDLVASGCEILTAGATAIALLARPRPAAVSRPAEPASHGEGSALQAS